MHSYNTIGYTARYMHDRHVLIVLGAMGFFVKGMFDGTPLWAEWQITYSMNSYSPNTY